MKKTLFLLLSLSLLWGCMDDPFENHSLQLEAEAGVTEAWLSLHVQGVKNDAVYTLQRNGAVIFNSRLDVADTVIYDSLLTPATSYRYRFFAAKQGETSPAVETALTTMDTTSHDFDWQVYTFGGQNGSSVFYDVAIIDENDIWAVGEIHTAETDRWNEDSTKWIPPYNAAHWDGEKWTLLHVNGNGSPIHVIQAFATNDIWFQGVLQWDGLKYTLNNKNFPLMSNGDGWRMNKMWGISSDDFYVVGNKGMMAHYDGTGWTKIESGTDIDIRDIYGSYNSKTDEYEILCVASNLGVNQQIKFFQIKNNMAIDLPLDGLTYFLDGIWFSPNSKYYIVGTGIFKNNRFYRAQPWKTYAPGVVTSYYTHAIAANDINDIIAVGAYNEIVHFNGKTWMNYRKNTYASFYEVDILNDLVVAVGINGQSAQLILGRR